MRGSGGYGRLPVGGPRRRAQTRMSPSMQVSVETLKKAASSMMYFITVPSVGSCGTAAL